MATREEVITAVARQNSLPESLVAPAVDALGVVDQEMLALVKASVEWGKSPASRAAPQAIDGLMTALKEATANKDVQSIIRIRSALSRLGHHNPRV